MRFSIPFSFSLIVLMCFLNCSAGDPNSSEGAAILDKRWRQSLANPLLKRGESHFGKDPNLIWNDPSVLKEGAGYTMWVSAGLSAYQAKIYRLTSVDGINWNISNGGNAVLEPSSNTNDFDCFGVETPAVLNISGTYHMYYSSYRSANSGCTANSVIVSMGHATSSDGVTWVKQGELTSLTSHLGNPTGNLWGWLGRAEPSVVYYNGKFFLYFADVRCREASCTGGFASRGISLAVSNDGHVFTQTGVAPILLQSSRYPAIDGWEGYSTPWAVVRGTRVDLFVDVAKNINGSFYQKTISHFTSANGVSFFPVAYDIVIAGRAAWSQFSVRSPTVIAEPGRLLMWYAGDNQDGSLSGADIITGLGFAEYK